MATSKIISGDATTGVVVDSQSDGGLILQTGTAGSKVDSVTIDSSGQATLLKAPKLSTSAVVSQIAVNTFNLYGSTNTRIMKFLNVTNGINGCIIQGSDMTFSNDAALGASITINTPGVYTLSLTASFGTSDSFGFSLNSVNLTTTIASIPVTERLCVSQTSAGNTPSTTGVSRYFAAGAVIRPHASSAGAGSTDALFQLTAVKVA